MTFPQLKIATEYSFRSGGSRGGALAFGPVPRVVARLKAIDTPFAGMVDGGTWGHTDWRKAMKEAGIAPGFGFAVGLPGGEGKRPTAWCLAREARGAYRLSTALRAEGADPAALLAAAGDSVIRFAGGALTDPATFDYIDINPTSALAAREAMELHQSTGKPIVITCDNAYPAPEDQRVFLAIGGRSSAVDRHIWTLDELRAALVPRIGAAHFDRAVENTHEVAAMAARTLPDADIIHVDGDLEAEVQTGIEYRLAAGHIQEWTPTHAARVKHELALIFEKKYESYFLVVGDLVRWAKTKMLVGPGRGSSAGSLVCYLLRITEVDPLKHDLLFERFIDVTRYDLPDIDIDFSDNRRHMVFEYLSNKYGADRVARLGSIVGLKPRSAINEVGRRLGVPGKDTFDLANVLIEYSSGDSRYGKGLEDTIRGTAPGRAFIEKHPAAWLMTEVEEHAWHTGIHAAGVIVCNEPVSNFATIVDGIAQIDKKAAESLNLLKIDVLGLRTLGVIEDAGVVDSETLFGLSLDDPEVFRVFNENRYSGIFQFEGTTQRTVARSIEVNSFEQIDHITALARPGPLGGGASQHYIDRAAGREPVTYRHPSMAQYLGPTMGVILYQEQVMRISFEIGKFGWPVVTEIRKAMSGRKGKEYFDRRGAEFAAGAASQGIPEDDAKTIWGEINNFGAWGMNRSHTVSYSIISYWCAWMKRYHPLEYAAACLRGAKDDEQAMEVLREMTAEGVTYIPFDIDRAQETWAVVGGELVGGFTNLRGVGAITAAKYKAARDAGTLGDKQRERLMNLPVAFADLRPAHSKWGHLYADPSMANVSGRIQQFAEMDESRGFDDTAVAICLVKSRTRRDRNESILVKRRNGKIQEGQTLFLDILVVDDSVSRPVKLRISEKQWDSIGSKLADRLIDDEDWLLVRGRWLKDFQMMLVKRVRCLTRPEIMEGEA